jgi:predicted nucleic acid-binding protein
MKRALFDTEANVAIAANRLIASWDINCIVTPVYIECVAGAQTGSELKLMRSFLAKFTVIDGWSIVNNDWLEALKLAERIPSDGKRRHLGDCLVKAIANRINYDVLTIDRRMAR